MSERHQGLSAVFSRTFLHLTSWRHNNVMTSYLTTVSYPSIIWMVSQWKKVGKQNNLLQKVCLKFIGKFLNYWFLQNYVTLCNSLRSIPKISLPWKIIWSNMVMWILELNGRKVWISFAKWCIALYYLQLLNFSDRKYCWKFWCCDSYQHLSFFEANFHF